MSRVQLRHTRCVHEPVVRLSEAEADELEYELGTARSLAFSDLPREWTCAKCRRTLVPRWHVPPERGL